MTRIAIWNCAPPDLKYAREEVELLKSLESGTLGVHAAGHEVTWDHFANFIRESNPTILHFVGHGTTHGDLLVNVPGGSYVRSIGDVLSIARAAGPLLQGAFLSGCHTARVAPESMSHLAPAGGWLIGTNDAVDDDLAAIFTKRFYGHFSCTAGSAKEAREAYEVACAYMKADWLEDAPHVLWMTNSHLPPVDEMVRSVHQAMHGIFERRAMHTSLKYEASFIELDQALQDMSHALGTGEVLSRRSGSPINPLSFPATWLYDPRVIEFVKLAQNRINQTRLALNEVRRHYGEIDCISGPPPLGEPPVPLGHLMKSINLVDSRRNLIIDAFNSMIAGTSCPPFERIDRSFSPMEIAKATQLMDVPSSGE